MAKKKCTIYTTCCEYHGIAHGAEALELREGLEEMQKELGEFLVNNGENPGGTCADDFVEELERMRDRIEKLLEVDARDTEAREMALAAES